MTTACSYASLREEDSSWDYRGEFTKCLTHGFHSYPAMMIPQVARRLIENYSRPGDTVLDPFCGSGSVLVEAKVLGRNSWGIDLNPVALLVARAKTTPIAAERLGKEYVELIQRIHTSPAEDSLVPAFFNLDYWFKPAAAMQLARIKRTIDSISGPDEQSLKEFFLVCFSEAVRLSSNSRSHEFKLFRYPPERLRQHNPDAIGIFRDRAEKNIGRMGDFYLACQDTGASRWCRPLLADSTQPIGEIAEDSVDVVVTSPPYGDSRTTVAYGQFTRLSAQWLGFDDEKARSLDTDLMGGRAVSTLAHSAPYPSLDEAVSQIGLADELRARQVLSFYLDLEKALCNVVRAVRPGGYLCIVIGNRRVKKVQLPTDVIVAEMAARMGMEPQRIIVRNIPSKTMPLKNSPTNIAGELELTMHKEYIVILKKTGQAAGSAGPSWISR